jgi:[ribosomal protein S18]-alanine N-acetyltransferase
MIEIVRPRLELFPQLADFFAAIDTPDVKSVFHPHAFTAAKARALCEYRGLDEYYLVLRDEQVVGYGLLRGWDEGFEDPSLGICIRPGCHGLGLGTRLMNHLIAAASARKSKRIILKVKKENGDAIKLYEKVGFVLTVLDQENFRGILTLENQKE